MTNTFTCFFFANIMLYWIRYLVGFVHNIDKFENKTESIWSSIYEICVPSPLYVQVPPLSLFSTVLLLKPGSHLHDLEIEWVSNNL